MNQLQEFVSLLAGTFDNHVQLADFEARGVTGYPAARHVNTVLNDRIDGLPEDFNGVFMLEESDYTVNGRTNPMPHLFLFTLEPDGRVKLTSYDMPAGYTKETFRAESLGRLRYQDLTPSAKFTPALYEKKDGGWEGGSESMFTPVLKFKLWERFTSDVLVVSESMEMNGKRTFGYDQPLEYRRCQ
ncbi:hypothetical protein [Dysosmobacter sp.]|uniref:hypothetical protein n=1 Tax=Dysosmobacter sp. TaxID=2591382 RepID=UPI003A91B246